MAGVSQKAYWDLYFFFDDLLMLMILFKRQRIVLLVLNKVEKDSWESVGLLIARSWVRSSLGARCCVFEQDTSSPLHSTGYTQEAIPKWLKNCWSAGKAKTKQKKKYIYKMMEDSFPNIWNNIRIWQECEVWIGRASWCQTVTWGICWSVPLTNDRSFFLHTFCANAWIDYIIL